MIRQKIVKLISKATGEKEEKIKVERPEKTNLGDYSTNIALRLKKPAAEIAEKLEGSDFFEKVEVAGSGFINFFVSREYLQGQVKEILKQKEKFGSLKIGKREKINVEFISANPTGPLHVGNARGGFCGDVLANVLEKAAYKPSREYYVNNMGRQIDVLKDSLEGKEGYKNEYIDELKNGGEKNVGKAIDYILGKIKETTGLMGIEFDKWFCENSLYPGQADKIRKTLGKKGLSYEKENALWFKSTKFGDDKDRVLIRANEKETYILSDLAYLENKFKRGFDQLIIFLGAEHHGYTPRLKAGAQALGHDPERIKPIVMQLVRLTEEGKEVKMSKRTGTFVTIDELLKEVGKDVARFFFLTRSYGNHLVFDLDLAKQQSEKNPVYYVQYAHARICSILRKITKSKIKNPNYKLLEHPSELNLVKLLIRLPEIVEDTAKDYQVQRLPQYAVDLAAAFHRFYRDCRVISEDEELTKSRLSLILATKTVLKNTLDLMGISAPEKM